MMHDIEVYLGIYMIVMIPLGGSNLMAVLLHWQIQRVRYMVNYQVQAAWTRMDNNIKNSVLSSSKCPGFVRTVYYKLRGVLASMIPNPQEEAARHQAAGGGLTGAIKNSLSGCQIF